MYTFCFFFFNDTATTEIYTLSLHDALPISLDHLQHQDVLERVQTLAARTVRRADRGSDQPRARPVVQLAVRYPRDLRSEEHTSELPVTPISRMPSSA